MKEYLKKYKCYGIWAAVCVFLVHGAKLFSNQVGIDTEDLIHLGSPFYDGWLNTGRQGLVLLKYLTGSIEYNPYFAQMMTLIMLAVSVLAFVMLWDKITNVTDSVNKWASLGCIFLWISHPVLVEQFYFTLQGAEIGLGMLLTAVALWLVWNAQSKQLEQSNKGVRRIGAYCLSGVILLITFSVYQIFVVLFIFGVVTVLLLDTLQSTQEAGLPKKTVSVVIKEVFPYIGVFLGAFLCNSIVTKLFFSESDYLNSQIQWGQLSFRDCVYSIAVHVRDVMTGQNSIFYHWSFGVLCAVGLIAVLGMLKRYGAALLFYYVALLTTPFLMTVVCADEPAVRSQLVLPAMTGFIWYVDVCLIKSFYGHAKKRISWQTVLLIVICVCGGIAQVQVSQRLYYTDACRYAEDEALGRALIQQLEAKIGEDEIPIVVIGSREFQGNHACVEGEIIGLSMFEHDVEEEPKYYWSTRRVIGFLHTLGYDCEQLPDKNIPYAEEFAEDMDVWPGKHSVEHAGDMVVIKLSETDEYNKSRRSRQTEVSHE